MKETSINLIPGQIIAIVMAAITMIFFFAMGSSASLDSQAEVCYAEKSCANNTTVTCKVTGPCDAEVTSSGVHCTGLLEDGTTGEILRQCKEG